MSTYLSWCATLKRRIVRPDQLQVLLIEMFPFALALFPPSLFPLHSAFGASLLIIVLVDNEPFLDLSRTSATCRTTKPRGIYLARSGLIVILVLLFTGIIELISRLRALGRTFSVVLIGNLLVLIVIQGSLTDNKVASTHLGH